MSKLYLFQYNNYFNRIVKRENSLSDYGEPLYTLSTTNFNTNDGVSTTHDINHNKEEGDYLVVTETIDDQETIASRWFVTEMKRLRGGQYRLQLRRDLIADYYDIIVNAPIVLQKGMVKKENNLIFNKEGFNVNQIKMYERKIEDSHNDTPWLYLYCAKNAGDINTTVKTEFTSNPDIDLTTPLSESIYANGDHIQHASNIYFKPTVKFFDQSIGDVYRDYEFNDTTSSITHSPSTPTDNIDLHVTSTDQGVKTNLDRVLIPQYDNLKNLYIASETGAYITEQEGNDLAVSQGKILRDSLGNYYRINVTFAYTNKSVKLLSNNSISVLILNQIQIDYPNATIEDDAIEVEYLEKKYTISASPITSMEYNVSIQQSTHLETIDSECNIIAIPLGDFVVANNGSYYFGVSRESQLAMARALAQKATTQKIYDMQLLPYSPFGLYWEDASIDIYSMAEKQYQIQTYNGQNKNILFYVEYANFTIDIEKTISLPTLSDNADINFKAVNELCTWRLCSPNFNGAFEFNVAKNRGVTGFNVDVTLKPYNPYIHVNPIFNGLYGEDYDDARGLICGGDFSLPITGDAFANYELNNKNYQIAFDRQIQNLEFTQGQEKTLAILGAITGTVQGGVGAGVAGTNLAGVGAGVVAGAVGGVASGIGGLADIAMLEARQSEAKSYAIDNYNYRLGNVKALPYSLNKVNPLTFNYKVFPFVEYYVCTDEEVQAFINKIVYTGMTLNVIGTISTFKTNYGGSDKNFYRGNLIRLENLDLPSHEAYEIYQEIEKGVYI